MKTVLVVGAGRLGQRVVSRAEELGLGTVAVEAGQDAVELGRSNAVNGVLAAGDVAGAAAAAEALGLPGIGTRTAHLSSHKIAMRRELASAGLPQPRYAAVRAQRELALVAAEVGFPAVLKPADSSGQRGLFLLESIDDLERHLHAALAESPTEEAIVESYHEGLEVSALLVARGGDVLPLTLSDRLRPTGAGFGVGWIHLNPSTLYGYTLEETERVAVRAVRTIGLRDGIALVRLVVGDGGDLRVISVAAGIPGQHTADLARHAVGVDLRRGRAPAGARRGGAGRARLPRFSRPVAIRFLTANPGPLPTGRVKSVAGLDDVLAAPGVVQAEVFLTAHEEIRPVRTADDRRGYVIAVGGTNIRALHLADAAAKLLRVEVEAVSDRRTRHQVARAESSDSRRGRRARPRYMARSAARGLAASPRLGIVPAGGSAVRAMSWGQARYMARPATFGTGNGARDVPLDNRLDVSDTTILVSACGAPGTAALLRALRENGERHVRLVGTDMSERAIGRHLCDAFHRVPAGSAEGFADAMLEVCRAEGSTPSCRSPRSTCSASRRRRSASRGSPSSSPRRRRSGARTTRPRPTRCSTGSASRARPGGASSARKPPPRRRASSATPSATSA